MSAPVTNLPLAPLGAGDLIDRAVRLYRRHLWTLMRIAAPPVLVTAVASVLWTIGQREVFLTANDSALAYYILLLVFAAGLFIVGYIFHLLVMGGATRNLVTHLLRNEPVSVRATYAAVRARFWGLLGATFIVGVWVGVSSFVTAIAWYLVLIIVVMVAVVGGQALPLWLAALFGVVGGIIGSIGALWLFFFMIGQVAYVPQVMLVEGRGVFDSLSRSFILAKGNVRRLMATTLFVTFATYAALSILVVPLGWFAWLNGVSPFPWDATNWPTWYAVGYSVLWPLSSIMLSPVWMLGLSLLYVDERVRHEGYDIELMAARQLEPMPNLNVESPFGPAISDIARKKTPPPPMSSGRVLGLS